MKISGNSIRAVGLLALAWLFVSFGSYRLDAAVVMTIGNTNAPESTLGGFTMSPLARTNPRFALVTSTSSSPSVGFNQGVYETAAFDPSASPAQASPPYFGSWSHGYTGNVWHTSDSSNTRSLTLTLPASTKAFYFYVQPVAFGIVSITLDYPGITSRSLSASGSTGAVYVGLHSDAGEDLTSIKITSEDTPAGASGFAVGEFGIFNTGSGGGGGGGVVPEPTSMAIFGLSGLAFLVKRVRSKRPSKTC